MAVKKKTEEKDHTLDTKSQADGNVFEQVEETVVDTKETETPKEDMIPASQVMSMLKDFKNEMKLEFDARLSEERKKMTTEVKNRKEINEEEKYVEDLADDWMDNPVSFFSYNSNYALCGDYRMGKEILPPNGKIKFKNLIRTKRRVGRDVQVICISTASVQSRKELEYLRKHSLYGIVFHESMNQTLSVDADWAQKLIQASQQVSKMSDVSIIERCKVESIGISSDITLMRKQLTEHFAKRNKSQWDTLQASIHDKIASMTPGEDGIMRNTEEKTIK